MWRLLCPLFLLLTGPVTLPVGAAAMAFAPQSQAAAPAKAAPAKPAVATAALPAAAQPVAASAPVLAYGDLERRNLILEAKSEFQAAAYGNLELFIAGLGVLMTVIVIFFALNTKDAAVKIAKGEVLEEHERFRKMAVEAERHMTEITRERAQLRDELAIASERIAHLEQVSEEFETRIDERFARMAHTERAMNTARLKAEADSKEIEERKNSLQAGSVEPGAIASSEADGLPLADKEAKDLTESDFSILISNAAGDGNVQEVYELAVTMRRLLQGDSARAYSRFAEGWALDRLGRQDEALEAYSDAIASFGGSEDAMARDWAASALLNKGVLLGELGRHVESIEAFDALVGQLGTADRDDIKAQVARALVQKGYQLEQLDRAGDAQAVFDGVVARFDGSDDFSTRHQIGLALFELAAIAAAAGDAAEAVALLRKWGEKQGEVDTDWIDNDARFERIRENPAFAALVKEHRPNAEA
jgi:tetratricopeptide (TPR) repeat protein